MIIMFIFLFLTIVFIIGTAIYLNKKKKDNNTSMKQEHKNNENKKMKRKTKKQLVDIFNIKIKDDIICIGNRYSKIIKLGNIDYNMLSNSEQESIENILIQTTLTIDYPIQFFSTTEFIDTSKVVSLLKSNKASNFKIREYKEYLIQYLQELMENKNISIIKNYAIISYDGIYNDAKQELNRKCLSFIGNLLRAKIICNVLNEDELYNLIYRELNKNSCINIDTLKEGVKNLYVGKTQKATQRKKQKTK